MTRWTLGQASKETGIGKSQLSKALNSGRMSYIEKTTRGYELDPAEVYRVFPPKPKETTAEQLETLDNTPETLLYAQKIAFLEEQIEALKEQIEKGEAREQQHLEREQQDKEEKKNLLDVLKKQGLMLEHLSKKETAPETEQPKKRRWWSW
jgi:ribosomal protein S15P/S13E